MRLLLLLAICSALLLLQPAFGSTKLAKRSVSASDLSNFRGAILVKNGKPTSCECALIDNKAAFVAANCLDLDGKRFREGVTYEIYFDGAKGNRPAKASVNPADIIIHPRYNPEKYSNNIAILQFSFTEQSSWVNYIAAYRDEWSDIAYVRRILTDANKMTWRTPKVRSFTQTDSGCEKASGLYKYNQDTFYCSRIYTNSVFSSTCNMPYGSIYGVTSSSMGIAGLYSHSVIYGTGVCGGYTEYHYYIVLTNYLKYARSVLGRTPKEFVEDKDGLKGVRRIINYRMKNALSANDDGTYMFGGDMISPRAGLPGPNAEPLPTTAAQPLPPSPPQPNPTNPDVKPTTSSRSPQPTMADENNNDENNDDENNNEGNQDDGDQDDEPVSNPSASSSNDTGSSNVSSMSNSDTDSDSDLVLDEESEEKSSGGNKFTDPADNSSLYDDPEINNELLQTKIPDVTANAAHEEGGVSEDTSQNGEDDQLSKAAIIAMSVVIPVGVILLVVIGFFLYKLHRKDHYGSVWGLRGSKREKTTHALVDEIGGASHGDNLPSYENLHQATSHPAASRLST
ncbi:hypothetical protein IWW36_005245 [Coemansia brasiliensis]|uniref:Peptidase S1 domain-containing protein n=1 Tax=Coemansia brasiliensis TaxID=2650707 RepID=A0A9W8I1S9_9FUNG|nr:hypothetical protein IWW36_005245 [Coemansia brasiliensis]